MAGADGQSLCWDLSRRAASFLRMARLALTGASPAQLVAEGEVVFGGHICDPYYKSISTEDDDDDDDLESDELRLEEDESELLVDGGEEDDGGSATRGGGVSGNKKFDRFVTRRHRASFRSENDVAAAGAAAEEESSEPLVPRRAAKRANDAEAMAQHPFGWDRRGSESSASALLLVSS